MDEVVMMTFEWFCAEEMCSLELKSLRARYSIIELSSSVHVPLLNSHLQAMTYSHNTGLGPRAVQGMGLA